MTTIHAITNDQVLSATVLPKVACNNQNTVRLHVGFDSAWDGYAKSAVFYTSENPTAYEVVFSSDNICIVPPEVLTESCHLFIGVKGVNGSAVKMSSVLKYKIVVGTPSVVISDPTASVYNQLLRAYGETKDAVAVERARINNLVKLESGSTTGDAELADARVDYNGKTHGTAGDAVRAQVAPIARQVKVKNLIDFEKLTRGYLAADGWLNNYNNGFTVTHEVTSDFIEVSAANTYYFAHKFAPISKAIRDTVQAEQGANGNWFCFALYDASKNFISRITYDASELAIDGTDFSGAAYVRVSYRTYMFNRPVFAVCSVPCEDMNTAITADNLIETYPMIFNGYVANTSGAVIGTYHDITGYIPTEQNELTSGFIPCEGGKEMFIFSTATQDNFIRIAFYREDGHYISSIAYSPTAADNAGAKDYENFLETFVTPENAVALRISCRGAYIVECVLAYNDEPRRYLFKECERKYQSKYAAEKLERLLLNSSNVKGVAHRGFSTDAPENTLSAYRLARKNGFDFVECDVSFTTDGYAVLLHDSTVDRTSNGTGSINALTLEEVRALDFGSWKSEEYAGEQIPRFEEFIELCKHLGLHPYIELKEGTEEQIKDLVGVVKRYGMKGKVTWISFNAAYLTYIKTVNPKARLGFIVDAVSATTINTVTKTLQSGHNEVFIDCSYGNASEEAVQLCANADIPLEVWTVNNASDVLTLDAYVSGVTSDNLIAGNIFYDNKIGG